MEYKSLKKIYYSEHSIYEKMEDRIGRFVKYDERNYNKKIITFYKYFDEI